MADSTAPSAAPDDADPENAAPKDEPIPPKSETLIADALAAGDITYEESLLQRAYALFDDPRLQPSFRTTIVNWEVGTLLDGRLGECEDCSLGTNAGWARVDPEMRQAQRASAYLLLDTSSASMAATPAN